MPISKVVMRRAVRMLGVADAAWLYRCARKIDTKESIWRRKLEVKIQQYNQEVAAAAINGSSLPEIDFTEFLLLHAIDILSEADSEEKMPSVPAKLANPARGLRGLMELWDKYKRTGKVPKRVKENADKIKKKYLEKVRDVYTQYSQDFRQGKVFDQNEVLKQIEENSDAAFSRAKMIVETETTHYYNKARKDRYDRSNDVTHYLFLAIRDQRTSKWCTEKIGKEGRGRHGLVYKKGDPLTDRETPGCHWYCRSEYVPLTPLNPRHLALIEDESMSRRNNKCTPLPKGWNAA